MTIIKKKSKKPSFSIFHVLLAVDFKEENFPQELVFSSD
jgi:hypothetical protein